MYAVLSRTRKTSRVLPSSNPRAMTHPHPDNLATPTDASRIIAPFVYQGSPRKQTSFRNFENYLLSALNHSLEENTVGFFSSPCSRVTHEMHSLMTTAMAKCTRRSKFRNCRKIYYCFPWRVEPSRRSVHYYCFSSAGEKLSEN